MMQHDLSAYQALGTIVFGIGAMLCIMGIILAFGFIK